MKIYLQFAVAIITPPLVFGYFYLLESNQTFGLVRLIAVVWLLGTTIILSLFEDDGKDEDAGYTITKK